MTCYHHRSVPFLFFALSLIIILAATRGHSGPLPANITDYFPVGKPFKGVKIPSYNDKDQLQSVMEADTITRNAKGYFDITNLKVKVFADNKVRTTVEMEEAIYHIRSGLLTSKPTHEKPKVIDIDFIMTGDKMTVNTVTQVTTMTGSVRVVIPNAKKLSGGFDLSLTKKK